MLSAASTGDVVFTLSLETLDDLFAREFCRPPDQTLLSLAGEGRVRHLLCADPWRSRPVALLRGRRPRLTSIAQVHGRDLIRVRPHRNRRRDPVDLDQVRRAYADYGRVVGRALSATGGAHRASLVTYHPFVAAWCRPAWATHTVYVGRDDWAASGRLRRWKPLFEQAYVDMRRPDVTGFAVSQELSDRLSPQGRATVVPNGVDAARWSRRLPPPELYAGLPTPVAVYAGTIDDRLDLPLVEATASAVGTLVLVGPVPDQALRRRLEPHERIVLTGRVAQDELVALVQHADVGVIPHADTELTRAMSPLKLYEYLAGGLPVVARDLPPVRGVHAAVRVADERSWAAGLRDALTEGRMREQQRQDVLADLSWSARHAPVVEAALQAGPGLA